MALSHDSSTHEPFSATDRVPGSRTVALHNTFSRYSYGSVNCGTPWGTQASHAKLDWWFNTVYLTTLHPFNLCNFSLCQWIYVLHTRLETTLQEIDISLDSRWPYSVHARTSCKFRRAYGRPALLIHSSRRCIHSSPEATSLRSRTPPVALT